jgi:hypothetical protein
LSQKYILPNGSNIVHWAIGKKVNSFIGRNKIRLASDTVPQETPEKYL